MGMIADMGPENCPLCKIFWEKNSDMCCYGCVVHKKTGNQFCEDTPYWDFHEVASLDNDGDRIEFPLCDEESVELAVAELEFLESLLPENEK